IFDRDDPELAPLDPDTPQDHLALGPVVDGPDGGLDGGAGDCAPVLVVLDPVLGQDDPGGARVGCAA
ncbi:hypothetical protein HK104_006643, partial [Borealophlyctis nickersoniae]